VSRLLLNKSFIGCVPVLSIVSFMSFVLAHPARSRPTAPETVASPHVLIVVAHPDDEYEMAGTVYHLAKELSDHVDQIIITDGEAGFRCSSLAERYYGLKLADEANGRRELPHIRREEARRSARVLGIEHQWFLNEKDDHFTLDADEVLKSCWNREHVLSAISEHLRKQSYDYVFILLPAPDSHGAHKAASVLALQAISELPADHRPVILGARASDTYDEIFSQLAQFPITQTSDEKPFGRFDRDSRFGYNNSLTYQIVVDWVIAEHKSQGLFQNRCRQDRYENFWTFQICRNTSSTSSSFNGAAKIFAPRGSTSTNEER
jgi:N-acetylglucosamine malate deacetylase 2